MFGDQTPSNMVLVIKHFTVWTSLVLFVRLDSRLCLIKHVLTACPLTLTLPCLVTQLCFMLFGRQKFLVCQGLTT